MSLLDKMRQMTTIVIDTGDIDAIKQYQPQDATTNPSLILSATEKPQYRHLIDEAVSFAKGKAKSLEELKALVMDKLFVNFGEEILKFVPGRVSTEVAARLSFDVEGSVEKARSLIALYEAAGVSRERILIKLASTWEGCIAARQLESESIHCNMTLMFSLEQSIAAAEAKATLISPFVGRIYDWYKKSGLIQEYKPAEDPGVRSVQEIYHYLKKFGYKTQVMGASFRNQDEIIELAGCDLLTIAPNFLESLSKTEGELKRKLDPERAKALKVERVELSEKQFRFGLNQNAMATEKLSEGIRRFHEDSVKLEEVIRKQYTLY